jgi:mRNA-degrading endonuclease RelE of RelBE toxin-antitoxin system
MRIIPTRQFSKDLKELGKKYPSITNDLRQLQAELLQNPTKGIMIAENRYKIQLKITSKGKGKSGGARVITYLKINEDELWLLTMYDKSEIENVNDSFLDDLVNDINS